MPLTTEALFDALRREIEDGKMAAGEQLPSISSLMTSYDVGKGVAQNALTRLREAGLVVTRPGGKTFVQGGYKRLTLLVDEPELALHPGAGMQLTEVNEEAAPSSVAEAMGLEDGAKVVRRSGVYRHDGRAIRLFSAYIPASIARGTALVYSDVGDGGIHARLEELDFGPNRLSASVVSRVAEPDEEAAMTLRRGSSVIELTRLAWSGRRCVELVRLVLDANVHELRFNLSG
jgi:GntR family transcriptional regulator